MADCKEIRENLEAYELRLLDEAESRACEAHLAACAACRAVLAQVQATVDLLEHLPDERAMKPEAERAILARLRAARPRRRGWLAAAAWLIAIGLGAASMALALRRDAPREDPTPAILARLVMLENASREREERLIREQKDVVAALEARLERQESLLLSLKAEKSELKKLEAQLAELSAKLAEREAQLTQIARAHGEVAGQLKSQAALLSGLTARLEILDGRLVEVARTAESASAGPAPPAEANSVRNPADAAFDFVSGIVRDRGRNMGQRVRDYRTNLTRLYGKDEP